MVNLGAAVNVIHGIRTHQPHAYRKGESWLIPRYLTQSAHGICGAKTAAPQRAPRPSRALSAGTPYHPAADPSRPKCAYRPAARRTDTTWRTPGTCGPPTSWTTDGQVNAEHVRSYNHPRTVAVLMPIKLMPVYRRGGYNPHYTATPMSGEFPALIRSPQSGRGKYEARWHRVKAAVKYPKDKFSPARIMTHVWCGQSIGADDAFTTDAALDGFPVCGACEGRALAMGLPGVVALLDMTKTGLIFEPDCVRAFKRPVRCPGSNNGFLLLPAGVPAVDVGKCAACGVLAPIRVGREYSHPARVLKLHDAGAGLVDPCEVHAWDDLILDGEIAVCRCKRDGR